MYHNPWLFSFLDFLNTTSTQNKFYIHNISYTLSWIKLFFVIQYVKVEKERDGCVGLPVHATRGRCSAEHKWPVCNSVILTMKSLLSLNSLQSSITVKPTAHKGPSIIYDYNSSLFCPERKLLLVIEQLPNCPERSPASRSGSGSGSWAMSDFSNRQNRNLDICRCNSCLGYAQCQ